jgi:hypothetical protein
MAKKIKIPKRVAGFKVPKALRKSKMLRQMLGSQLGREVLAGAITAGAGAAAAVLAGRHDEARSGDADIKGVKEGPRKAASMVAEALEMAATTALGVVAEALDNHGAKKRPTRH